MKRLPLLVAGAFAVTAGVEASSKRLIAVVSDLHLDENRPVEAMVSFLNVLQERGGTLVLNGDVFELGGGTASETLARLDRILDAQPALIAALESFAEAHRVVFVPGHADAALLFPEVAARLGKRVRGTTVATDGFWVSEDGRIVCEHGHQLPGDPYRYRDWPRPFASGRLAASWGARHIDPRLAELSRFPILEHLAEPLAGLAYGLSVTPEAELSPELMKELLLTVSWEQFRRDLELEVEPPAWDLEAIHALGDAFILQSVLEDDPLYERFRRAGLRASELSDEDILLLCDYRAAVRRARRRMERGLTQLARVGPAPAECPRLAGTQGPSFSYFWSSRDRRYRGYLAGLERIPDVVVHGHTHLPDRGFVPRGDGAMPLVVNAGAFARTVTPAELESLKATGNVTTEELLETLTRDDLFPCYSLVLVEPYDDEPTAVPWYWSLRDEEGRPRGTFSRRCE